VGPFIKSITQLCIADFFEIWWADVLWVSGGRGMVKFTDLVQLVIKMDRLDFEVKRSKVMVTARPYK